MLEQPAAQPVDPFDDLENFRLSADYEADGGGVNRPLLRVPVVKPNRQEFIRVHPDPAYSLKVHLLELKEDREYYLFLSGIETLLPEEVYPARLTTYVNRQGVVKLWPIRLPGLDGKTNPWNESALEISERAVDTWTRVASNLSLGAYQPHEALGDLPGPVWPKQTFKELLRIAFKNGRLVDSDEHPLVQRLYGAT